MPPYRQMGSIPRKRHLEHRAQPGYRAEGLYYEEVITTAGFGRAYSIAYHLRPPTRVREVAVAGSMGFDVVEQETLRHHHLKSGQMKPAGDPVTGRVPLLTNDDVTLWRCRPAEAQATLFRNAAADEVIFVHRGLGVLESMFGALPFKPFDYVVIPRSTTYRMVFEGDAAPDLLVIESSGGVGFPPRYLTPTASSSSAPPTRSATCTARPRRCSSIPSRTSRSSSRTAPG
jgi:homogentisate 1,2-dioxygenase